MYGDLMGAIGGRLYEVWDVYGDPMGVIGGHLYEVWDMVLKLLLNKGKFNPRGTLAIFAFKKSQY